MSWAASRRVGDQLRGRHPFNARDIPAIVPRTFFVNVRRNIIRRFKCHHSGNALDRWSLYRRLPIRAAVRELRDRLQQNKQQLNHP